MAHSTWSAAEKKIARRVFEAAVDRELQAFGERIQYSVFECHFTLAEARQILASLATELDPQTDSLRAYPLCAWCEPAVKRVGEGRRSQDKRLFIL